MISVTKLIEILDKPALKYWSNKIGLNGIDLRNYEPKVKEEGNIGHKEIESFIKHGTPFNRCEDFKFALKDFEVIGVEVDCDNGYICGRIDLVLSKDNQIFVVDLKRNKNIYLSTKLQLSAYKHIIDADFIMYMNLKEMKLIQIKIETQPYFNIVKRLYQIKKTLIELNESL